MALCHYNRDDKSGKSCQVYLVGTNMTSSEYGFSIQPYVLEKAAECLRKDFPRMMPAICILEHLVLTKEGIQTIGVFGKVLLPGGYI